ncbi:YkgJ family cysteine cluster protein [Desulfopila aestuarii]|uniref:Zinc-or iron-chelating domain-containing protein n=1 Tax=Desulfopila aestuarii DSM 18488 TaxID=1121416 RepID=A0A1M7XZ84_9BACT|nr:hypothetical protein [Desulfopila aestuarii]SHO44475.1 hypothetical protein SAMN02745220_00759 [Desulfopila aestuarii DSM 18488]
MLQELEFQVLELYHEVDRAVTAYQAATGLNCPGGCVECCFSEKVEATVLEMVPLAFHLFRTCQAELILKRIEKEHRSHQCILFRPDLSSPESGGCSQYPFRALICRMFGFAGNIDRNGRPQLARCRNMPLQDESGKTQEDIESEAMPLFHAYGIAITAIHPSLGTQRMPINEALHQALAKVGLILDLEIVPVATTEEIDLPPDSPATTPSQPKRKAA